VSVECDLPPVERPEPPDAAGGRSPASPDAAGDVYPQSVASGGPTPTGVIVWTRIAPDAVRPDAELAVEVAPEADCGAAAPSVTGDGTDAARRDDGTFVPARRFPVSAGVSRASDYTVRVDLDRHLEPATAYRYRFVYDGVASRTGRCRTLPAPDASPASVSFAVLACQDYHGGYYGALGRVAREDVDFLLHLGDYIYDDADGRYSGLGSDDYPDRDLTLPSGEAVAHTLADFRTLYRTYRSDPLLAAAAAAHTTIRTWDDHAVADNRYWDYEADAPVAPSHPRGDDPVFATRLTADAIRAFYEYTPARVSYDPEADHLHDAFRLYDDLQFGDLLALYVTDERLYREPPPCADSPLPGWGPICPERTEPDRTMLGATQREWLLKGFRTSDTRWTAWANEVLSLPFRAGVGPVAVQPLVDSWDGYPAERDRLFDAMAANDDTGFVTLTGDLHSTIVGRQRRDGRTVGLECMTPAVTSVNLAEAVGVDEGLAGRLTRPLVSGAVETMNSQMDRFDSHHWGYAVAEFTPDQFSFDAYAVDKTVDRADAPREHLLSVDRARDRLA
jgi:alkaline phosphatase D